MNVLIRMAAVLALVGGCATRAHTVLNGVEARGREIRIECSQPPVFEMFTMKAPLRLAIDFRDASSNPVPINIEGVAGSVERVVVKPIEDGSKGQRVVITFKREVEVDVRLIGNALVIKLPPDGV